MYEYTSFEERWIRIHPLNQKSQWMRVTNIKRFGDGFLILDEKDTTGVNYKLEVEESFEELSRLLFTKEERG